MNTTQTFTLEQAQEVAQSFGINWQNVEFSPEEFLKGMLVELEHGSKDPETDVTHDDPILTGKIAWAHLKEFSDYYTRLAIMEAEAERQ
ncbi:hypothetical protein GW756_02305 [bacterium]|nr:hypothetical protein [bacterium]NCQ55625.1 hypothetical protein [Candidatus Parcubacteria bacterium]NCS67450.1 hypothetical protein [Candidatus Peregrinibacteria bacterium]NCS96176.1 hypothetical protein [bacterium]